MLPLLAQVTRDEVEFVTELRYMPTGWLAVAWLAAVALIGWVVFWLYRHEGRIGASRRVRLSLAAIRTAVFVALAVILLEPVSVRILRRWIDSYTVLLVDRSSSMDLSDIYRDGEAADQVKAVLAVEDLDAVRRTEVVNRILEKDERRFLRELTENNRIKVYTFSDEPELLATVPALREDDPAAPTGEEARLQGGALVSIEDIALDGRATGPATNIERAVRRAVDSLASAPIAAIVVLSDGGFNQGASADVVARFARERRLPIHTVGIGDPSSPQNVRVTEVVAPPNAFQRDPFTITAGLSAEGLDPAQTDALLVRLRERSAGEGGDGRVVDTRRVALGAGGTIDNVTFERRHEEVGRYVYTVEVPTLEGESVADDNAKQVTVNIIDSRTRALLVSSLPTWEYRFVSRLLERDNTFDVSCWLQSADLTAVRDGNTIIDHMPVLPEELFEYDLVILFDPARGEMDAEWCRLMDTFVTEYGGGLLYAAARPYTPDLVRDPALEPLFDLLPVVFDPEADIVLNEIGHYQLEPAPLDIPDVAYGHPVMQLADDPASTKLIWQRIGQVYWHYPVAREKPAATVLMRHGDPRMRNNAGAHVLAAVQFVGAGRTGFLAFQDTWRWRRRGVEHFDRFWVQLLRYLSEGKLLGGTKRGMLFTESDQYSLGDAVTVTARLFNRQYEPLRRDQVIGRYAVDGERREFVLTARSDRPGWFEGRFVPGRTGSYRVTIEAPDAAAGEVIEIAREIQVTRPNIEVLRPQMDRDKLLTLARESQGGQYFPVDQAANIPQMIPDLHEEIPIRSRPTTLWDNWVVLTVLLALLTVEWGVRKWNRLL